MELALWRFLCCVKNAPLMDPEPQNKHDKWNLMVVPKLKTNLVVFALVVLALADFFILVFILVMSSSLFVHYSLALCHNSYVSNGQHLTNMVTRT